MEGLQRVPARNCVCLFRKYFCRWKGEDLPFFLKEREGMSKNGWPGNRLLQDNKNENRNKCVDRELL